MVDVSSEVWSKQEAAVLSELSAMGLAHKPLVTAFNKMDLLPLQHQQLVSRMAQERVGAVPLSARTLEGLEGLADALRAALLRRMWRVEALVHQREAALVSRMMRLGSVDNVAYSNHYVHITASVPMFLLKLLQQLEREDEASTERIAWYASAPDLYNSDDASSIFRSLEDTYADRGVFMPRARVLGARQQEQEQLQAASSGAVAPMLADEVADEVDWKALGRGRHQAVKRYKEAIGHSSTNVQSLA